MKTYTEYKVTWWDTEGDLAEEDYVGSWVTMDKSFAEKLRDEKLSRPFDVVNLLSRQITDWEKV